jgi:hypothetical protein
MLLVVLHSKPEVFQRLLRPMHCIRIAMGQGAGIVAWFIEWYWWNFFFCVRQCSKFHLWRRNGRKFHIYIRHFRQIHCDFRYCGIFFLTSGDGLIVEHGRVGIGTTNPDRLLDVKNGSIKVIAPNDPNFNNSAIEVAAYNQSSCYYGEQFGPSPTAFFRSDGGFGLELHDGNNGGKGTGLDIGHLDIDWNLYTDPSKDLNFAFNNTLKSWILDWDGSYHNISDMRLKKDIKPFSHVLDGISKLQAYTYHMKDAPENSPVSIGFMAQEVEQQFPQMVVEKDGFKTLCYDQFAVLSIQAIKEQEVKIDSLEKRVSDLEALVMEMKGMINTEKKIMPRCGYQWYFL